MKVALWPNNSPNEKLIYFSNFVLNICIYILKWFWFSCFEIPKKTHFHCDWIVFSATHQYHSLYIPYELAHFPLNWFCFEINNKEKTIKKNNIKLWQVEWFNSIWPNSKPISYRLHAIPWPTTVKVVANKFILRFVLTKNIDIVENNWF